MRPALRTSPLSNTQRQRFDDLSAVSTSFTTGKPLVYLDEGSAIPLAIVVQLVDELSPSTIGDVSGQLRVLHHVLDRQILDRVREASAQENRLILTTSRVLSLCR